MTHVYDPHVILLQRILKTVAHNILILRKESIVKAVSAKVKGN